MKNLARAICAAVFLIGLMVFSLAQSSKQAQDNSYVADDIEPAQPYVAKMMQYRIEQDGSRKIMTLSTIYQRANGESRIVFQGPHTPGGNNPLSKYSKESYIRATLSDGLYTKPVGTNSLIYESARPDERMLEHFRSHKALRNQSDFVRADKVAGLEVYVLRKEINNPASNIEWIENSYSPKTGWGTLRGVVHFRDGSEIVSEVLSVEFKEVPEDLNDDLKDLPISNLEEKIRKQRNQ